MQKDITTCPMRMPPPKEPRDGESVGGGFFVIRRGGKTNRLRPGAWPFEFATFDEASEEARRLSSLHPDRKFYVSVLVDVE